jgi:hypothetical protein
MAEKEQQHIVPATFLRQFEIKNPNNKNHVWCIDFTDKYNNTPKPKGVNSKIFKIKNFYSLNNSENRLILENFYSQKIEPLYNQILSEINQELNLSEIIRIRLIEWILHSNQRTEYNRNNIKRISKWMMEMNLRFESFKKEINPEDEIKNHSAEIEIESKNIAKEIQLNNILNPDKYEKYIKLFTDELIIKKWTIFKANDEFPFIANDNPGFSLNTSHLNRNNIFNSTIHLNHPSFNYLVLSPKYCLYIEPFKKNDSLHLNAFNIEIEYKEIEKRTVDFINLGTCMTSMKYIISNDLNTINKWNKNN